LVPGSEARIALYFYVFKKRLSASQGIEVISSNQIKATLHRVYVYLYWRIRRVLLHGFRQLRYWIWSTFSPIEPSYPMLRFLDEAKGARLTRVGSPNDGGYLLPDLALEKKPSIVISPGADVNVTFESHFAEMGSLVICLDASVEHLPVEHPNLIFVKKFLGPHNSENWTTLETILEEAIAILPSLGQPLSEWPLDSNILQMDIEGWEWQVFEGVTPATLQAFEYMIVEFHDTHLFYEPKRFKQMTAAIRNIMSTHRLVFVHRNNGDKMLRMGSVDVPPLLEVTFARKDINFESELEIPASAPNSPEFEDEFPNWLAKYAS